MTHVVVNGDDLGIARGVNTAIGRAFNAGVLTSASLMANMPAFDDAVERVIAPNARLGVGVHLVLTSGACVSAADRLPLLVHNGGTFKHGFIGLRRLVRGTHAAAALGQIERELRAQCEKVLAVGFRVDHLDGHRHIHMIPEIWQIVVRLAAEYGLPYVRLADEEWAPRVPNAPLSVFARNLPKKILLSSYAIRNRAYLSQVALPRAIRTADHIVGILDSDAVTAQSLGAFLNRASGGTTEIIVHPGLVPGEGSDREPADSIGERTLLAPTDRRFISSPRRGLELEALTSAAVLDAARRYVHLTSFGELAAETHRAA